MPPTFPHVNEPPAPTPGPVATAVAAWLEYRNQQWREWLVSAPGRLGDVVQEVADWDAWHDNRPDLPDAP